MNYQKEKNLGGKGEKEEKLPIGEVMRCPVTTCPLNTDQITAPSSGPFTGKCN